MQWKGLDVLQSLLQLIFQADWLGQLRFSLSGSVRFYLALRQFLTGLDVGCFRERCLV